MIGLANTIRAGTGSPFRVHVHSSAAMEPPVTGATFRRVTRAGTVASVVDVYVRTTPSVS